MDPISILISLCTVHFMGSIAEHIYTRNDNIKRRKEYQHIIAKLHILQTEIKMLNDRLEKREN